MKLRLPDQAMIDEMAKAMAIFVAAAGRKG
jgi:hypothetical protein